ncbi:MAG: hypothetical protein KDA60_21890 [Planctomycetales bacterium]|nr:hypothetical protein [Planctomycetales bacterium]
MLQPMQPIEHKYEVSVGHTSVTVTGTSVSDAIRHARQRLCRELPRLWDVIQSLDEQRFRVMEVQ